MLAADSSPDGPPLRPGRKGSMFARFSSKSSAASVEMLTPHTSADRNGPMFNAEGRSTTEKSDGGRSFSERADSLFSREGSLGSRNLIVTKSPSFKLLSRENSANTNAAIAPEIHKLPSAVCRNASVRVIIKPRASNPKKRDLTYSVLMLQRDDTAWEEVLDEFEFQSMRKCNYEAPFKHLGSLKGPTAYAILFCRGCDAPLFQGKDILDISEGYPKLKRSMVGILGNVLGEYRGMPRAEVHCKGCGSFIGSIENDFVIGSAVALVRRVLTPEDYALVVPIL